MGKLMAFAVFCTIVLYILYVLVMRLKDRREKEGGFDWWEWFYVVPIVTAGYLVDIFYNVVIASAVFLDPPDELTLTDRLNRYYYRSDWRGRVARKIAPIVNAHDPGHIGD